MAGYGPKDFQFAEFYDCYTILHACTLEDAGIIPKGEAGPVLRDHRHDLQGHASRLTPTAVSSAPVS